MYESQFDDLEEQTFSDVCCDTILLAKTILDNPNSPDDEKRKALTYLRQFPDDIIGSAAPTREGVSAASARAIEILSTKREFLTVVEHLADVPEAVQAIINHGGDYCGMMLITKNDSPAYCIVYQDVEPLGNFLDWGAY